MSFGIRVVALLFFWLSKTLNHVSLIVIPLAVVSPATLAPQPVTARAREVAGPKCRADRTGAATRLPDDRSHLDRRAGHAMLAAAFVDPAPTFIRTGRNRNPAETQDAANE